MHAVEGAVKESATMKPLLMLQFFVATAVVATGAAPLAAEVHPLLGGGALIELNCEPIGVCEIELLVVQTNSSTPTTPTQESTPSLAVGDIFAYGGGQLPIGGLAGGFGGVELGGAWCPAGGKFCLRVHGNVGIGSVVGLFEVGGGAGLLLRGVAERMSLMASFFGSLTNDKTFRFAQASFGLDAGIRVQIVGGFTLGLHVPIGVAFDSTGRSDPLLRILAGVGWEF